MSKKLSLNLSGKKILIAWYSYNSGGAERQMLRLAQHWRDECGATVSFWGARDGHLRAEMRKNGWQTYVDPLIFNPTSWWWRLHRKFKLTDYLALKRVKTFLTQSKPDLVVSILSYPNVYFGNMWFKIPGIKGFVWNQADMGLERMNFKYELKALQNASAIITNAQGSKEFLCEEFEVPKEKIAVIHNILPEVKSAQPILNLRHYFGLKKNQRVISMVANLTDYKDHKCLLEAWRMVCAHNSTLPNSEKLLLCLAGRKDVQYENLLMMVDEFELHDQVRFLGEINNVSELLMVSDIAVLASNSEGSSNAVAEYMIAGLPVVTTSIPANIELLGENYGYYYNPGDVNDLKAKLISLLADLPAAKVVGQENKSKAELIFNNQLNLVKYRNILEGIAEHDEN